MVKIQNEISLLEPEMKRQVHDGDISLIQEIRFSS